MHGQPSVPLLTFGSTISERELQGELYFAWLQDAVEYAKATSITHWRYSLLGTYRGISTLHNRVEHVIAKPVESRIVEGVEQLSPELYAITLAHSPVL